MTAHFLRWKLSHIRLLFGALLATIYVAGIVLIEFPLLDSIYLKLVYAFIILYGTFGKKMLGKLWITTIVFFGLYMFIGGTLLTFYYISHSNAFVSSVPKQIISASYVISLFPIVALMTKKQADYLMQKKIIFDQTYPLALVQGEEKVKIRALVDTGNQLYDALTNKPIAFVDADQLKRLFSPLVWDKILMAIQTDCLEELPEAIHRLLIRLPYVDVSGKTQYTYAIKIEKMTVFTEDKEIHWQHMPIGIQLQALTSDNQYQCIIHPAHIMFGKE